MKDLAAYQRIKLGDVAHIKTGKRNNQDKNPFGKYPFFVRSSTIEKIDTYSFDGEAILMPGEGNIGDIIHYIDGKFDFHQRVYKISNFIDGIYGKYVFYALQKSFKTWALKNTVKATVDSLRLPTFQGFEFLAPDFQQQKQIVRMLEAVNTHISNLEKLISKQESIKKSTINLLLAPRSNWQEIKLGDTCSITTGKLDANAMSPHGKYAFFTCAKEVYKINNYAFDTEALLVSGNGSHVGYVHYYKGRFNAYQRTYVLDKFTANILFVKYFLDCKLSQRIDAEKKSGNTPYILRDTLYDMKLTIPVSITEQERIATQLSKIDAHIENLKQQLAKQRAIKQGLMQYFFGD